MARRSMFLTGVFPFPRTILPCLEYKGGWNHSSTVASLSLLIGRKMSLSPFQLAVLEAAARLHDVGKSQLPDYVLSERGGLDETEWEYMYTHPANSGHLIRFHLPYIFWREEVALCAEHHHDWWNGESLYPETWKGSNIPIQARIISLADNADALTAKGRKYHTPLTPAECCEALSKESGSKFDPAVVEAFLAMSPESHLLNLGQTGLA